jgi:predicted component of type VI protein secretion system
MTARETVAVARRMLLDAVAGREAVPGPRLVLLDGGREADGATLRLRAGLTIGRSRRASLRLAGEEVSRLHARIVDGASGLAIVDAGSKNGVRVNGRAATAEVPLREGDVVELGTARLRVRGLAAAGAAPAPAAASAEPPRRSAVVALALLLAGLAALLGALA